ncbi:hypothetical protein BRD17_05370 [Halobacteriales archaeon SW_7_68_16]|nr:MAG: hypothetical protein BRD17_05370 [Halobacteriales archaeon SW_7_68_16]
MSQSALDDDELFDEIASETRREVEEALEQAYDALPAADAIWDVEGGNSLGMLNGLKAGLDVGAAESHLRDAKKSFLMGQRADAFDDADDLEADIADLEALIGSIEDAHEMAGDLASTIPELKSDLDALHGDEGEEEEEEEE